MAFGGQRPVAPPASASHGVSAQAKALDIVLKPPRFGVAIFNNPNQPTSGVACCEGQRPTPFNARTELPSDTIWLSDAYMGQATQNFRSSDYLRSTTKQIGEDLGVDVRDPVDGLPVVAECIARVRDMAAHAYPWMDMSVDWSDKTLGRSIAKVTKLASEPLAETVVSALRSAFQAYSKVPDIVSRNISYEGGTELQTLRVNRLRYAHYICSQSYPVGEWRAVSRKTLLQSPIEAFLDPTKPTLVEASVEFLDRDANAVSSALMAYGSSASPKASLRTWISQPELAWLVEHANVHISAAIVCDRADVLPERLQLPRVLTADPIYALSVAAGVLAECHWSGVASEIFVRRSMPGATAQSIAEYSPYAVWMRAYDRAYSFQMALELHKRGITVSGYGYGAVTFYARKAAWTELRELADAIGACHPDIGAMQERQTLSMAA